MTEAEVVVDMDKEEQDRVRVAVEEILVDADIKKVSEKQVRELASEKTGIDLSASRESRKFVLNVIKKFMESLGGASDAEADDETKASPDEDRRKSSKKMKETLEREETEEVKEDEDVVDEDDEDDEEETGGGKKRKYETDEEGNFMICELSAKRKVVVNQFRGKTLVSVREYYEKDGKVLPSSKGISLTSEQFQVLANSVKDIDVAISSLK